MTTKIISLTELRARKKERYETLKLHDAFEVQNHRPGAKRKRLVVLISVELADTLKKMGLLE